MDFSGNSLVLVASNAGRNGSIAINQYVDMYVVKSQSPGAETHPTSRRRHLWIQVIKGEVMVGETKLLAGDGAGLHEVEQLQIEWTKQSEFILFDMP